MDTRIPSSNKPKAAAEPDFIEIVGAYEHNLHIERLEVPKRQLVVFTGVSGSGKSSLAFDTLYAEGQRRYIESLSAYARQFLGQLERPKVEHLRGLSPTIAIEQIAAEQAAKVRAAADDAARQAEFDSLRAAGQAAPDPAAGAAAGAARSIGRRAPP